MRNHLKYLQIVGRKYSLKLSVLKDKWAESLIDFLFVKFFSKGILISDICQSVTFPNVHFPKWYVPNNVTKLPSGMFPGVHRTYPNVQYPK